MAKKNNNEAVTTEVETSAAVEVAEVEQSEETIIPEPVETTPVVEDVKVEEATVEEVVAEEPKPAAPAVVTTTVQKKTAPNFRRYRLVRRPAIAPKGQQRLIVLHLLMEALKAGKRDISAEEMVADATKLQYYASAGTLLSIQWHLHQMKLKGLVELTNETYMATVEQSTTPAEATMSNDEIDAQIAKLNSLKK